MRILNKGDMVHLLSPIKYITIITRLAHAIDIAKLTAGMLNVYESSISVQNDIVMAIVDKSRGKGM